MASAGGGQDMNGRGADSLTFFPSLEDDTSPTTTIRSSPRDQRRASRPNITSLLFTPRQTSSREPLFGGFDPLSNELDDALQDRSPQTANSLGELENEFEGLERSISAPPQSPSSPPPPAAEAQKKRAKGNSISSFPGLFKSRALGADRPALKSASLPSSQPVSRPASVISNRQLAPVEMNYWFPQEALPPALNKQLDTSAAKIDRFGFLYEEKRNRRQHDGTERRPSSIQGTEVPKSPTGSILSRSRPSSISASLGPSVSATHSLDDDSSSVNVKWYDYLTSDPTGAVQFLSDMPFSGTTRLVQTVRTAVNGNARTQGPLNKSEPVTAISTQSVSPATDIFPESVRSESSSATDVSVHTQDTSSQLHDQTAKALLKSLNDEHERGQQRKKREFEEFMHKSLALRLRNEESPQSWNAESVNKLHLAPEAHLVEGSVIGFASIGLDGQGAKSKRKELHRLILQGVPVELRSKVWGECMRSQVHGDPEYYQALLTSPEYAASIDRTVLESIDADVQRTLKDNVYFRDSNGPGVQRLTNVLVALAKRNPRVGYCQGMNLIAGSLLLVLPTEEEAFWLMVFLMENVLPDGYMGDTLITSRADSKVLRRYVGEQMPQLAACLDRHEVWLEFEVNAISWFVSAFTAVFCGEALYRIWDVVFCWKDGDTFMLCVALALLKLNEKALLRCDGRSEISGYLNGKMTDHAVSVDGIVRAANALRKVVQKEDVHVRRREEVDGLLAML